MNAGRTIMTIDIGNTAMKVAVFRGETLIQSVAGLGTSEEMVRTMLTLNSVDGISYCCVGNDTFEIGDKLEEENVVPVVRLLPDTPLPIEIVEYDRSSLGADRVAAAVGAIGERPALVIDAGTAVTADLVADGKFLGGNISPGLKLRFRSLNSFTSRLPLVRPEGELGPWGHDTTSAIRAGVVMGLVAELMDTWHRAQTKYKDILMILTGGDADFLAPLLMERGVDLKIDHETVGRGLVRIFNHNNDNEKN